MRLTSPALSLLFYNMYFQYFNDLLHLKSADVEAAVKVACWSFGRCSECGPTVGWNDLVFQNMATVF